jgi:hypothetical protein
VKTDDKDRRDYREKIHTGQVLEARHESRITASPMQRLVAGWLAERARFIGSLLGLTDEQFSSETAAGQWTYRVVAKHVRLEPAEARAAAQDRRRGDHSGVDVRRAPSLSY